MPVSDKLSPRSSRPPMDTAMLLLTINPLSYKYFSKSIHVKFSLLAPYEEDPSEEITTGFKSNLLQIL